MQQTLKNSKPLINFVPVTDFPKHKLMLLGLWKLRIVFLDSLVGEPFLILLFNQTVHHDFVLRKIEQQNVKKLAV